MRGLELRRVATYWQVESRPELELDGAHHAYLWEQLDVTMPGTAAPYCCYANTVIFYRDRVGHDEIGRCTHADLNTPSPTLLFLNGRWWEAIGGQVVQRDGSWWMKHRLADNTRMAREANLGRELERRNQTAGVN